MHYKNNFLIPAVIFTVAVSIVGWFWVVRGANQLTPNGLEARSIAIGTGAPMGADGTITTTGAIITNGGVILNNGGAATGLIVQNGNVGIPSTMAGYKINIVGESGTISAVRGVAYDTGIGLLGSSGVNGIAVYGDNAAGTAGAFNGNVRVYGNTTLGDASTDTTTVKGSLSMDGVDIKTYIQQTTGYYYVGNNYPWNQLYSATTERRWGGAGCPETSGLKVFGAPGQGRFGVRFQEKVNNASDYVWAYLKCGNAKCSDEIYLGNSLAYNVFVIYSNYVSYGEKIELYMHAADTGGACVGSQSVDVKDVYLIGNLENAPSAGTIVD